MPNLPSNRNRRILADMGLSVWVERAQLQVLQRTAAGQSTPSRAAHAQRVKLERLQASLQRESASIGPRPMAAVPEAAADRGTSPFPGEQSQLPVVQCTWLGDWVLLAAPRADKRARQFTRDLLWAAAAQTGTPSQLAIDATQLAADVGASQAQAALTAFVDKRLGQVQATGLLMESSLAAWQQWLPLEADGSHQYRVVGEQRTAVLVIPDLDALMRDGAAKLRCWRAIQALQGVATRRSPGAP